MLCLIYVLLITVALYYASHQTCPRMATTAATLRQIWSGGCQSCRASEVSGLSGLEAPASAASGAKGVREACVCDVCPCAAIDVVVRAASPVAGFFDDAINLLNHVYCYILKLFIDMYEMFCRVLECRTACRHQAQILDESHFGSLSKFNFGLKKPSISSKIANLSSKEQDVDRTTTSSLPQDSLKVKDEPLLRLFENTADKESVAKTKVKTSKNMASTAASGEIEPTMAVERTRKVATEEKGVDMHFDEDSYGTEDKNVENRPDAESLPSSSHEGTSQFPDRSRQQKAKGFFKVSNEKKSDSSVASQAYCDRCKERGKLCVPCCPKASGPNASCERCKKADKLCVKTCPKNYHPEK